MALKSGLTLYCYTLPTSQSGQNAIIVPYADELDGLTFTTVSPGGFGQLTATLRLNATNALLPQPQLAFGAHVALMDGPFCAFRGEIMESAYVVDASVGDAYQVTALGIGNQLRDDPYDVAYSGKTAQQIAQDQLTHHGTTFHLMPQISSDNSLLFPDNPAGTYSPSYDGRTMEEIILDIATLAGIYDMAVWDHATQKDAAGFPLGQVSVVLHDANTTHYQATLADRDIVTGKIAVSGERAYNFTEVAYSNGTSGVGLAQQRDSRLLAGTFDQNLAPFRFRKYRRDVSGTSTIGSTQASSIATSLLQQMENLTNKVNLTLSSVKDAQGNPLDMWRVRAAKNIYVPDLAVRGQQLATSASATVNQFFILQTTYTETTTSATLAIQADNYEDYAERQIARLQLAADQQSRGFKFTSLMAMLGAPVTTNAGGRFLATAASQNGGGPFTWPLTLYQTPTSATLTPISSANATGATVFNLSPRGGTIQFTSVAAGDCFYFATLTSQGNTIRAINERRGSFAWHCSGCDRVITGLGIERDLEVWHQHQSGQFMPGQTSLTIECPACHMREGFNTALSAFDEDPLRCGQHHAEHAQMIRRLMRHLGWIEGAA